MDVELLYLSHLVYLYTFSCTIYSVHEVFIRFSTLNFRLVRGCFSDYISYSMELLNQCTIKYSRMLYVRKPCGSIITVFDYI